MGTCTTICNFIKVNGHVEKFSCNLSSVKFVATLVKRLEIDSKCIDIIRSTLVNIELAFGLN